MARITEENKALIAEKEAQIEKLKEEIKSLKGPIGIASLTKNLLITAHGTRGGGMIPHNGNSSHWMPILRVCLNAFGASYVSELTEADMYLAAEMADEIIEIFNKYYKLAREEK